MDVLIALDIGGTKINSVLSDYKGNILKQEKLPSWSKKGAMALISLIETAIASFIEYAKNNHYRVKGIGVSTFGQIDNNLGKVIYATDTIPGWSGIHLKKMIEEKFQIHTEVENDGHSAGWGEMIYGNAKQYKDVVFITLGTGIGGSIFINRKLLSGSKGLAGLIGHTCIDPNGLHCNCGAIGCIEQYSSGSGIEKAYAKKTGFTAEETTMSRISTKEIFSRRHQEKEAQEVINAMTWMLGGTIGSLITLLNPEAVILGGGVSNAWDDFYRDLISAVRKHSTEKAFESVSIEKSSFPDNMGIMGAVGLITHGKIPRIS